MGAKPEIIKESAEEAAAYKRGYADGWRSRNNQMNRIDGFYVEGEIDLKKLTKIVVSTLAIILAIFSSMALFQIFAYVLGGS